MSARANPAHCSSIGLSLYLPVYLLFPELRGLLRESGNAWVFFGLTLLSAVRYLANTCSYTSLMVSFLISIYTFATPFADFGSDADSHQCNYTTSPDSIVEWLSSISRLTQSIPWSPNRWCNLGCLSHWHSSLSFQLCTWFLSCGFSMFLRLASFYSHSLSPC
jgi:hypothetical protein